MKVWLGPTGKVSAGHVLDVAKRPFEQAMRFALNDPLLYVRWNPAKLAGWGCWEIRRKASELSIVDTAVYEGNTYVHLERAEIDLVNHVLDCAFLNYDQIRKLKEMDTWAQGIREFGAHVDAKEQEAREKIAEKSRAEVRYASQHYKKEIAQFKEYVQSGHNPAEIAAHWQTASVD